MNAAEKHRRRARRKAKGITKAQKGAGLKIQLTHAQKPVR